MKKKRYIIISFIVVLSLIFLVYYYGFYSQNRVKIIGIIVDNKVVNVGIVRYDFKVIVENIGTNDLSNILLFVTIYNQNHESISYGDTGEVISYIASGRSTEHSFQRMINASELSNSPYLFIRAYGGTGNNDERTLMLF